MKSQLIITFFAIFIALTNFSCKKEHAYMNNAEIIGYDARLCPCCGGTEITIDHVANPNQNPFFLIGGLPANFDLGSNPKFPIAVKIDWNTDTVHCFGNYINITRIERR